MANEKCRFETHFEVARRLGLTPAKVKRMALASKLGSFGVMGSVVFLPTDKNDTGFFEQLIAARYFC